MKTLFLSLLVLLLTVPAYALEGGTPPGVSGGTPPPEEKTDPGILVCEGYVDNPETAFKCKGFNGTVSSRSLEDVSMKGYRLIQIVDVKGKLVYYFQK